MKIYRSGFSNSKSLSLLMKSDSEVWHACDEGGNNWSDDEPIIDAEACPYCKIKPPEVLLFAAKLGVDTFLQIKVENGEIVSVKNIGEP